MFISNVYTQHMGEGGEEETFVALISEVFLSSLGHIVVLVLFTY